MKKSKKMERQEITLSSSKKYKLLTITRIYQECQEKGRENDKTPLFTRRLWLRGLTPSLPALSPPTLTVETTWNVAYPVSETDTHKKVDIKLQKAPNATHIITHYSPPLITTGTNYTIEKHQKPCSRTCCFELWVGERHFAFVCSVAGSGASETCQAKAIFTVTLSMKSPSKHPPVCLLLRSSIHASVWLSITCVMILNYTPWKKLESFGWLNQLQKPRLKQETGYSDFKLDFFRTGFSEFGNQDY